MRPSDASLSAVPKSVPRGLDHIKGENNDSARGAHIGGQAAHIRGLKTRCVLATPGVSMRPRQHGVSYWNVHVNNVTKSAKVGVDRIDVQQPEEGGAQLFSALGDGQTSTEEVH